jgi:ribonucleoside-diphosphate reductase alpha chain
LIRVKGPPGANAEAAGMQSIGGATVFTEPRSVEAWDAWFRWRHAGRLQDLSIDHTWRRVAGALGGADPSVPPALVDAFTQWRLLPDERLLARAGTGLPCRFESMPRAVLVLPGFITGPRSAPRLDWMLLRDTAKLAVRALEGARNLAPCGDSFGIGVIGLADALQRLQLDYDSDAGCAFARQAASGLAHGCLEASIECAAATGRANAPTPQQRERWQRCGMEAPLVEAAVRSGVAHDRLTCIERAPRLALFANDVSDALDPRQGGAPARNGRLPAQGQGVGPVQPAPSPPVTLAAQLRMRAALAPWIDAPIDHHLYVSQAPCAREREDLQALTRTLGLPSPAFRRFHSLQVA